jgi:hypothetical protein
MNDIKKRLDKLESSHGVHMWTFIDWEKGFCDNIWTTFQAPMRGKPQSLDDIKELEEYCEYMRYRALNPMPDRDINDYVDENPSKEALERREKHEAYMRNINKLFPRNAL